MKKILNVLYTALCHFALSFSGIILFLWLVMWKESNLLDYEKIEYFLRFSSIFGIASVVFAIPNIPYMVKVLFHFIIVTVAFAFTIVTAVEVTQVRAFFVIAVFVVIYAVIFAVVKGLQALAKKLTKNV